MTPQERDYIARKPGIVADLAAAVNDKSPKGGVDVPVQPLLQLLNAHPDYVTTSSCSGRVAVYADTWITDSHALSPQPPPSSAAHMAMDPSDPTPAPHKGGQWLMVSHDPLPTAQADIYHTIYPQHHQDHLALTSTVTTNPSNADDYPLASEAGLVHYKFEPLAIHVQARTLEAAQRLLTVALACGYRNSGVVVSSKRHMVAIRSSLRIDAPIATITAANKAICPLVDRAYLALLVNLSNRKFSENEQSMVRLHGAIQAQCFLIDGRPRASADGQYPDFPDRSGLVFTQNTQESKEERRIRKQKEGLLRQQQVRSQEESNPDPSIES
ncbi:hypothetical protein H4R35_001744 [Dimargaris xerosporica]|nr:hypothetical protein H4R35_001744 [Dimargaris xerosporica]